MSARTAARPPSTRAPRGLRTALVVALGLVAAATVGAPVAWSAGRTAAGAPAVAPRGTQAEALALDTRDGRPYDDAAAAGGRALALWSEGAAVGPVTAPQESDALLVRVRGDQCEGAPQMTVALDGQRVATAAVPGRRWSTVVLPGRWAAGEHQVALTFDNDHLASCDRNLRIDQVSFRSAAVGGSASAVPAAVAARAAAAVATAAAATAAAATAAATAPDAAAAGAAATSPASGPLAGARFWVDPDSDARRELARTGGDARATAALTTLAEAPGAVWLGDWTSPAQARARAQQVTTAAAAQGQVAVLVLYAVPGRDCGGYSAGGLGGPEAYGAWVREVAAGIGDRVAAVVVEPDALAQEGCLSQAARGQREAMLRDAVTALAGSGAVTYLDAGHSGWVDPATTAARLRAAGVERARGFSLGVAGTGWTADEEAYGEAVSALLGGAHYVVDTGRNGNGPASGPLAWCNPRGRAVGDLPSTSTGAAHADAHLWVKPVGQSDGDCGRGEPAAGTWWPAYAVDLVSGG